MPSKLWDEITYSFPNFHGAIVEIWEWISDFVPHFIVNVVTYPWWNYSESVLVKGAIRTVGAKSSMSFEYILSCHLFLMYFPAGYEDWKSWRPECGHLFTLPSSVIIKHPFRQDYFPWVRSSAYWCQYRIVRLAGEVIMLSWKIFHPGSDTNNVTVWYL